MSNMARSKEIYLYHGYMYGDCDCYHCEKYKSVLKCELCGDPATTWNCFGDGPKRVCKGCDDLINKFYKTKCDLTCIQKKENKEDE